MHCDVYKFPKSPDWYVYIARPNYPDDTDELCDWLGVLPSDIRAKLGLGQFVMHLDLSERTKLAQADIETVKVRLAEQGYYVQAPPADVLAQQALARAKALQDKKYD
ncbi:MULTISPECIES: YcgL domain-containing protein [Moraxella]|uniref:YcgL domain-containing protein A9309_12040 n=1 Tax=Moraxella lacunata TaxID=477 RepID=A0A1B8PV01_MORLA|nr:MULTISPECIES: YcgL domain-containing protein [Moraxella]MBE9579600.1 YcgL domain-containing protein [Moraxella sp. K1664]MBE9588945.1 YcgL domain-containing protein [Moraxella sp. K1630]MBE9591331.1 YcgL domain-containing protein [Moraxella sp. K127]MBE9597200.1 YcgL domain-containing protein [Moraxella sp. K2450]MDH9219709.1 YcgL domain-containing protein [Moraxella lacunata]